MGGKEGGRMCTTRVKIGKTLGVKTLGGKTLGGKTFGGKTLSGKTLGGRKGRNALVNTSYFAGFVLKW